MTTQNLISEIALRCGDVTFTDFEQSIYKRAVYRANREIAKQYGIFKKILTFRLQDMVGAVDDEIILDVPDLKAEYLVNVNGIPLVKVAHQIEPQYRYCYYMERLDGLWHFNYTMGNSGYETGQEITGIDITEIMSKSVAERIEDGDYDRAIKNLGDQIVICYNVIPNIETEIGEYDIDTKFEEEQINRSLAYMAELGLAKFPDVESSEKAKKYYGIYRRLKDKPHSDYDKNIAGDNEWVKIQPFSVV